MLHYGRKDGRKDGCKDVRTDVRTDVKDGIIRGRERNDFSLSLKEKEERDRNQTGLESFCILPKFSHRW